MRQRVSRGLKRLAHDLAALRDEAENTPPTAGDRRSGADRRERR